MRFVFVGGCARSGTSLVQKLLVSHSRIVGGPEFDHTDAIFGLYREMSKQWRLERQEFYYDQAGLTRMFTQFYERFFEAVKERKPEAAFLSEKTPSNIFAAETLLTLWPDSVFVNVVRDGRDVVLSHRDVNRRYRQLGQRNPERDTLMSVTRHWNACAGRYSTIAERPDLRDRILLVRFEELVSAPTAEVGRLLGFLGLATEERQLRPELITEQETGVALEGAYFTRELYRQPFNSAKVGRWSHEMNPTERLLLWTLMRENLERFGYSRSTPMRPGEHTHASSRVMAR